MSGDVRELAEAAQAALARGDGAAAQRICAEWAARYPADPNAPLLAGIAAYRQGAYAAALEHLHGACGLAPGAAQAWHWLGNAHRQLQDHRQAANAYRKALAITPMLVDAAHNLAWSCRKIDDDAVAGAAFAHWGRLQPTDPAPCQHMVDAAARLARAGQAAPAAPVGAPARLPLLSFVVCSVTPSKLAAVQASLAERMAGHAWELIAITDARSLCEAYLRGARQARGDVLVFCHDDIEFLDAHFAARLADALDGAEVVGACGTSLVSGPAVAWAGLPHVHGWITHLDNRGGFLPGISSLASPRIDGAQAIDGLFMAVHRHVLERVPFDPENFDGFHFYDLDFSYRAYLAGLRVRIQCDLLLTHASTGNFNEAYWRYAERFCLKFPHLAGARPPPSATFFQTRADTREEVRRFYGWIAHWLQSCPVTGPVPAPRLPHTG